MLEDLETINNICNVSFNKLTGVKITKYEAGQVEGEMEITENHHNSIKSAHGGVIFTLADVIGGFALKSVGIVPTTIDATISFFKPVFEGKLFAKAEVMSARNSVGSVSVRIYNDEDEECARYQASYYNLNRRK